MKDDDQRHGGGVEAAVGKRQRLRVAEAETRASFAAGRVRAKSSWPADGSTADTARGARVRDQLLGEGAVAAADFDPVETLRRIEPVEESAAASLLQRPIIRS